MQKDIIIIIFLHKQLLVFLISNFYHIVNVPFFGCFLGILIICSETSAHKIQKSENHPKEEYNCLYYILQSSHKYKSRLLV